MLSSAMRSLMLPKFILPNVFESISGALEAAAAAEAVADAAAAAAGLCCDAV